MTHLRHTTRQPLPELDRNILPRWLERINRDRTHATIRAQAVHEHGRSRPITADSQLADLEADPHAELRCIPIMGATRIRAVIPGTDPLAETIRRDNIRRRLLPSEPERKAAQ
ncbi:MAG: hypothetical protein KJ058_00495 [Thermoanaerobaculia bacterium]|nr:hypothetical protein [Thermoanaerobaculia bacterium]